MTATATATATATMEAIALVIGKLNGVLLDDHPGQCARLGPGGSLLIRIDQSGSLPHNAEIESVRFYDSPDKTGLLLEEWTQGESSIDGVFEVTQIKNGALVIGVILKNIGLEDRHFWYSVDIKNAGTHDPEIANKAGDPPGSTKWEATTL
jgi:hypothetical protein